MSDRSGKWLKTADTKTVAQIANTYGPVGFIYDDLTLIDVAEIATHTISDLDRQNLNLLFFFHKISDDSVQSSKFVLVIFPGMTLARIDRHVTYHPIADMLPRIEIRTGPLMQAPVADRLVKVLNELNI